MQEYLAERVKEQLATIAWLERLGGLTQTLEETRKLSDTESITLRYPVTRNVNEALAPGAYAEMLPDSRYKGLCYFETGAFDLAARQRNFLPFTGRLRLVVWCNPYAIGQSQADLQGQVLQALNEPASNCGTVNALQIRATKITESEDGIFKRYNYQGQIARLLLFPYYAFAVDLELTGRYIVAG